MTNDTVITMYSLKGISNKPIWNLIRNSKNIFNPKEGRKINRNIEYLIPSTYLMKFTFINTTTENRRINIAQVSMDF